MISKESLPPEALKLLKDTYILFFKGDQYIAPLTRKLKDVRGPFIQPGLAFRNNLEGRRVSTTLRQVLAKFNEFFHVLGFPQRNFAPGSPSNDDRQLGRPTASPFLSLLKRISLFQNGSL